MYFETISRIQISSLLFLHKSCNKGTNIEMKRIGLYVRRWLYILGNIFGQKGV